MVYGRKVGDRTLDLEASGALKAATLIMRDRQTDSWWSIMTASAIGGPLTGTSLKELPVSEKTTWKSWRERYPNTLVLSVQGLEHVENNPYDNYFRSDDTFRNTAVKDGRLPPKAPIYAFWLEGVAYAVPHSAFAGGKILKAPIPGASLLLARPVDASIYASSEAWLVRREIPPDITPATLLGELKAGTLPGAERLGGFDTFWYTWVGVNEGSKVLGGD